MNVTYEHKNEMTFIGFHTEIAPDEGYKKCPEFWDKEYSAKYARLWQTMTPAVLYVLCGVTNVLDGFFARKLHTESEKGAMLDSTAEVKYGAILVCAVATGTVIKEMNNKKEGPTL